MVHVHVLLVALDLVQMQLKMIVLFVQLDFIHQISDHVVHVRQDQLLQLLVQAHVILAVVVKKH
jgi:hypothetical protein